MSLTRVYKAEVSRDQIHADLIAAYTEKKITAKKPAAVGHSGYPTSSVWYLYSINPKNNNTLVIRKRFFHSASGEGWKTIKNEQNLPKEHTRTTSGAMTELAGPLIECVKRWLTSKNLTDTYQIISPAPTHAIEDMYGNADCTLLITASKPSSQSMPIATQPSAADDRIYDPTLLTGLKDKLHEQSNRANQEAAHVEQPEKKHNMAETVAPQPAALCDEKPLIKRIQKELQLAHDLPDAGPDEELEFLESRNDYLAVLYLLVSMKVNMSSWMWGWEAQLASDLTRGSIQLNVNLTPNWQNPPQQLNTTRIFNLLELPVYAKSRFLTDNPQTVTVDSKYVNERTSVIFKQKTKGKSQEEPKPREEKAVSRTEYHWVTSYLIQDFEAHVMTKGHTLPEEPTDTSKYRTHLKQMSSFLLRPPSTQQGQPLTAPTATRASQDVYVDVRSNAPLS